MLLTAVTLVVVRVVAVHTKGVIPILEVLSLQKDT